MSFEERYQLRVPLGQTDRGTVWSGNDAKLGREVVIAVVEADAPEALRERFAAQMEKLAALRHASVVRVFDVGRTDEGAPYASMEPVEGETLEARMSQGPAMRADQAVRVVADLLGALATMHAAGIVHGDIEPANVFVKERGGRVTPKLVGFGLDRAAQRAGKEALENGHFRTLAYMSPEQAEGADADPAADVYSAAALLFSLLTGRAPHRGADPDAMRRAARERDVPRVGDVREELAGPIGDVVDQALARDPKARFDSADALSKALRAALIRTRNPGAFETVVGLRTLEADESDEALAQKRTEQRAAPPAPARPAAASTAASTAAAARKRRPPKPTLTLGSAPLSPVAPAKPKPEEPSVTPEEAPKADEEVSAAAPPPPPEAQAAPPPARPLPPRPAALPPARPNTRDEVVEEPTSDDESLEFERLSGLLEIPDASPPQRFAPPPPRSREAESEAAAQAEREPEEAPEPEAVAASDDVDVPSAEEPAQDGEEQIEAAAPAADETVASAADDDAVDAEAEPVQEQPQESVDAVAASEEPAPPPERAAAPTDAPSRETTPFDDVAAYEDDADEVGVRKGTPGWVWAAGGVAAAALVVVGIGMAAGGSGDDTEMLPVEHATLEADAPPADSADPTATVGEELPAEAAPATAEPADELPADEATADEATADDATAETEASADATADGEPEAEEPSITVTLTGVPAGASITVDGEAVEGSEITLPRSDGEHALQVTLDGHLPWTRSVVGDASTEIAVELEPEPQPRRATRTRRHRQHGGARHATTGRRAARTHRTSSRASRQRGSRPTAVSDPGF